MQGIASLVVQLVSRLRIDNRSLAVTAQNQRFPGRAR